MKNERRKNYRLRDCLTVVRCPLKYLFDKNYFSKDISEEGMCLFTNSKLEIGKTLKLGVYLPEEKSPLIILGKVVRRHVTDDPDQPYLLGIEFVDIEENIKNKILSHIRFYLQRG
ncbi:MAG: PilZ domain-containing protein [Candidatus Omnitrophica bacterium]|nr:PilZ domain-containing protein [Candidatus Omnitrophota bacterium]MCK5393475.1 PilZ domain-containing protein [Candidatus Omnitrophota bacterium]MCK5493893.1 PilZ domain-containing protein [Candidatus Omnitrophota bacterium]